MRGGFGWSLGRRFSLSGFYALIAKRRCKRYVGDAKQSCKRSRGLKVCKFIEFDNLW